MPYKLIALDLDGTVLRENLTMSARVHRALRSAAERGVQLTLASGRGYPSMRRWVEELRITVPVICYQGAVVTDPLTRRCLRQRTFPLTLIQELADLARRHDLTLTLYADDQVYVKDKRHADDFYEKWFGLPCHVVDDLALALPTEPFKCIYIATEAELDRLRPDFERQFAGRLRVMRSHRFFLEGLPLGADKGTALAWVAERLGISREETMAIGDSGNDAGMIAWAGLGVAMGNASAEAKSVADYVAPSVDDDGLAQAIERFCLKG
ncbi:MAG TPA: Cof-type HAD-IIB family hydrolase [Anaerolineae bacterium]|nr:Cof-type HAD-IIB family hydrolase [Anaerolineae bacterium]